MRKKVEYIVWFLITLIMYQLAVLVVENVQYANFPEIPLRLADLVSKVNIFTGIGENTNNTATVVMYIEE